MLEILDTIQVGDVLFHVLDNLDLFGMEIQSSLYGRGFYLFPLGKRQEYIFIIAKFICTDCKIQMCIFS